MALTCLIVTCFSLIAGCGSKRVVGRAGLAPTQDGSPSGNQTDKVSDDDAFLRSLEARYEAFLKPLALNSWNRAVGNPTEDVSRFAAAEKAFFGDESIDTRLRELANSTEPEIRELAMGWLDMRQQDTMSSHASIAPLTKRLQEVMAGSPNDRFHGQKALMTIYSSANPKDRDLAMQAIAERSQVALPILAERSAKLNALAQSRGFKDYLDAKTGKDIRQATQEIKSMCKAQIEATQEGWARLMTRGRNQNPPATDADYFALSTAWSAEAGFFIKADQLRDLSARALSAMGYDLDKMNIEVRITPNKPGGAAYRISIPEDVRFRGFFPDGFEGARGWFHELGHAVHMKEVRAKRHPFRTLPFNRALNEGIGEIFGAIVRDPQWLRSEFPNLTPSQAQNYRHAIEALDAFAARANCYHARLELSLFEGPLSLERLKRIHKEVYGTASSYAPSYPLYIYLFRPLYVREYVVSHQVTTTFLRRLGKRSLLSKESGDYLREMLLAPGARLTLERFLKQR